MRLAHRGDWRGAPENSLAAFRAALDIAGCDGIELDVRASADRVPVVIHDETLDRVQGVAAAANRLSAADLTARGVPALGDVCSAVGAATFLDVELKEWVPAAMDVLEQARGEGLERAVVSSFDEGVLDRVGRARPGWRRWLNLRTLDEAAIGRARNLRVDGIAAQWRAIDDRSAAATRKAGLELAAWTVRRRSTYRRLERLGVVAICAEAAALDG